MKAKDILNDIERENGEEKLKRQKADRNMETERDNYRKRISA